MKLRTKLFLIWGGLVVLLWSASLWPVHQAVVSGVNAISAQAFDGTTQGLRTVQAARVEQMRQACQLVMNIPELRALIVESGTKLSPENLSSLQERLDHLASVVGVRGICVLNWQGSLIAQNHRSPWDSLSTLQSFVAESPQPAALIYALFHPVPNATHAAHEALWQYNGQFYDVIGEPLTFSATDDAGVDGALIMAAPLTDDVATQLAASHNCDVSFIAGTSVVASSLSPGKRDALASLFANNKVHLPDEPALELGGVTYRATMQPLVDPCSGTFVGGMWIQTDLQKANAASASAWRELVLVVTAGLVLAAIGSYFFSGFITKPVDALIDGVRRVADGDFEVSIAASNARGELEVLAGAFNDMVGQLRTQRHLQKLVETSRAASSAKSQFLANMSHEIRTPLHGVLGITDLLLKTTLDDQQRKYVGLVKSSAEVLTTLINDILDFSKIEAGKLDLETIEFSPRAVVQDVVDLLSQRAGAKNLSIIADIPDDLPRNVFGDPNRLRQVLINLVSNAIKFTETGRVTIRAAVISRGDGPVVHRFEVVDTGIGIPADRMDRLFQSFSQVDASTTRKHGGTGLGLAICKQLVELMGGEIGVSSVPRQGTTFFFTVAFRAQAPGAESNAAPAAVAANVADRPAALSDAPAVTYRVLVAEDNEINQIVARELLVSYGYECETVSDGQQAVDAALTGQFDLILMDCQMPELDGLSATRAIRQREAQSSGLARGNKRIPILALTANASGADRDSCFSSGMDGYCGKPFHPARLVEAMKSLLEAAQPVTAAAPTPATPPDAAPAAVSEPIEISELMARCTGKADLANTILQKFQTQSNQALSNLRQCVDQLDAVQLAAVAHALKGTAGLVAAGGVARIAAGIEQAGHDSDFDQAQNLLDQLNDEVGRCARFVAQYVPESNSTGSFDGSVTPAGAHS